MFHPRMYPVTTIPWAINPVLLGAQNEKQQQTKFSVGEFTDCPVFEGLYRFCQVNFTSPRIDVYLKHHRLGN